MEERRQKRILFLADRNILIDQTMVNDFRPFKGAMANSAPTPRAWAGGCAGHGVGRRCRSGRQQNHQAGGQSYEIYLSLYQAVTGTDEERNIYKQFSPDFFDLIVVDECHRGSAAEDSAWRDILTYFASATQIGLTATPKGNQRRFQHRLLWRARLHPTASSKASKTATWPRTKSSASIWTKTPSAGAHRRA